MNPVKKANKISPARLLILLALSLVVNWPGTAGAQNVFRTQEADIYYTSPSDLQVLESRLNFHRLNSLHLKSVSTPDPAQAALAPGLAAKVDGLLAQVRHILHFCPKNRERLRIILLKDGREVRERNRVFSPERGRPLFGYGSMEGFYEPRSRTIFLSLKDVRSGVLAHEMTHFILCECVAVPPPEAMQEDWARYVETQVN